MREAPGGGALKREARPLRERERLFRLAPHLVKPKRLLMPLYSHNQRPAWLIQLGMIAYDVLFTERDRRAGFAVGDGTVSGEESDREFAEAVGRALERGDDATAYRIYFPVCALVALQLQAGLDGFLAIEKYLLHQQGLFATDRRRHPYAWSLDEETRREIDRLCPRVLLLDHGRLLLDGPSKDVCAAFYERSNEKIRDLAVGELPWGVVIR